MWLAYTLFTPFVDLKLTCADPTTVVDASLTGRIPRATGSSGATTRTRRQRLLNRQPGQECPLYQLGKVFTKERLSLVVSVK